MRRERFTLFRLFSAVFSIASVIVSAIATPIFNLFSEAFPPDKVALDRSVDTVGTEVAERQSQTGKGIWAFVTDLFNVEGRTYCHQGGGVA